LHIQTVIFEPIPENQKNIEVLVGIPAVQPYAKEADNYKFGESTNIPYAAVKVTAKYDTVIRLNGDVQTVLPSNTDPTALQSHNDLVNKMWSAKVGIMSDITKIVSKVV